MYKRILIIRTDRVGDVILTTPLIKAIKDNWPQTFLAVMIDPLAKEIVEGNPYLDQVIIYDKFGAHKGIFGFLKFVFSLRRQKFDLALVLHTKKRTNLIAYFAGIKQRLGYYNNKFGFLLTQKIRDSRPQGLKHEIDYCLDVGRAIGIEPKDRQLYMPIKIQAEQWADELLRRNNIAKTDRILAIHPGASCPSKIWPNERFAQVADELMDKYNFKVLLIAAAKDAALTSIIGKNMRHSALNLGGATSLSQLASILRRSRLFISNDSGPVHIAAAVGTAVISIFGRSQSGLSPRRWGPAQENSKVLHKEVGCIECLAHNCTKEFACLKAITVSDVINAADEILENKENTPR